jgi:hypothetical protein
MEEKGGCFLVSVLRPFFARVLFVCVIYAVSGSLEFNVIMVHRGFVVTEYAF